MKYYDLIIIWWWWWLKLRQAADLWKKIAIIEKDQLWWTCLNRWCIPSKMFIYPSDLLTHFKEDANKLHIWWEVKNKIKFKELVKEVNETIEKESQSIEPQYKSNKNIDFYHTTATFVEDKVIKVENELLTAHKIYIATGSKPHIPSIKWLTETPFFTSRELLKNIYLPKKMVVIWWWYIAAELWHFYWAAWCDVHFLLRWWEFLKNEDKDIRKEFSWDFAQRYNVHYWVTPVEVSYKDKNFYVSIVSKKWENFVIKADWLFVATGVVPNTTWLWLENTEIQLDSRWFIMVDDHLETNVKWVYWLWDVIWNYLFRHSVNCEWEYLLDQHYISKERKPIVYPPMPHAVFSYPQIAWVWVTEDELIAQWKVVWEDYFVGINRYEHSAMWMASKPSIWLVKVISDVNGKLLWGHIVWEKASDIIGILIVYVSQWSYVQEILDQIIFIHPALSEVIRNALRKLRSQLKNSA